MTERKPSRRAAAFWRRLIQTYGARISEQYGPTCPPDWCVVVDRTDPERLELALIAIRRDYLQFPPTLGQFEAAIPKKKFGPQESVPDRLAELVVRRRGTTMCRHQLARPWSYFGKMIDTGERSPLPQTNGVVVPSCVDCGRNSLRVLAAEL